MPDHGHGIGSGDGSDAAGVGGLGGEVREVVGRVDVGGAGALARLLVGAAGRPGGAQAVVEGALRTHASPLEALFEAELVEDDLGFAAAVAGAVGMPYRAVPGELEDGSPGGRPPGGFPVKVALRHRLLPVVSGAVAGGGSVPVLEVHTSDPFNLEARADVGQLVREPEFRAMEVRWVVVPRTALLESLRRVYGLGAATFDDIIEDRGAGDEGDALAQEVTVLGDDDEATVMSFVNQIFREALAERATDIHIEPLEGGLQIRYRVDGALQEVPVPQNMRVLQASLVSRLKIMAQLDIAERRLPQDGRINLELDGKRIDVRVATIPSVNGESVSLRILARERFDLGALGLDQRLETRVRDLLENPNGIILVTGPTGSGKSTTLYTFLRTLNTKDRRIVTIEDPVENKLDGIVQIAVKPEIGLTFAAGLRSILRGDPNVIMVGEMRDLETTEIAIRGALTGHLVFSTLHTNDAIGGISRLLDMGIEPFLIASSVRAFLAQRLVRTLCDDCKTPAEEHQNHDQYLSSIGFPVAEKGSIYAAVGCRVCRGTGYRGRMAIMEVCEISSRMQELVAERAGVGDLRRQARSEGMLSLREHGWSRVVAGRTTVEEILAATAGDGA